MKTLKNKPTTIAKEGEDPVDYAKLAEFCLNYVPKEVGIGVSEMRKRHRILDVIEESNGLIELEDADAQKLQQCVRTMRWGASSKEIIEFCDAVEAMPTKEACK